MVGECDEAALACRFTRGTASISLTRPRIDLQEQIANEGEQPLGIKPRVRRFPLATVSIAGLA
jgi:hypothetical protein